MKHLIIVFVATFFSCVNTPDLVQQELRTVSSRASSGSTDLVIVVGGDEIIFRVPKGKGTENLCTYYLNNGTEVYRPCNFQLTDVPNGSKYRCRLTANGVVLTEKVLSPQEHTEKNNRRTISIGERFVPVQLDFYVEGENKSYESFYIRENNPYLKKESKYRVEIEQYFDNENGLGKSDQDFEYVLVNPYERTLFKRIMSKAEINDISRGAMSWAKTWEGVFQKYPFDKENF